MYWGHFNLRMSSYLQARNIFDDPTSKYSTMNIRCRVAQSVERKTDMWDASGSMPRCSTFVFSRILFIDASETHTGNAANINVLDLSLAHEVQFIQYEP
jgi:hypothetical protein